MARKLYFSVAEAALYAGRSKQTISDALREKLSDGGLHGFQKKVGGKWWVRIDHLEAWMEGRPIEPGQPLPIEYREAS